MGDTPGAAPPVPETEGLFLIIGAEPHFLAGKKEGAGSIADNTHVHNTPLPHNVGHIHEQR